GSREARRRPISHEWLGTSQRSGATLMQTKSADQIFWDAAQIEAPAERAAYLQEACGSDLELRQKVEMLLQARTRANSFLEAPAVVADATSAGEACERPGTVIDQYKLMEQIGEGGMGLVFVAEQQQPVRRKVALKVIKPGMDSREIIARFEA